MLEYSNGVSLPRSASPQPRHVEHPEHLRREPSMTALSTLRHDAWD